MVELKFTKDKPILIIMKGKKQMGIFYVEDNYVHNFDKKIGKQIYHELETSDDSIDNIVSRCADMEFADMQILEIPF